MAAYDPVTRYCSEVLGAAVSFFEGGVAVFGVDPPGGVHLIFSTPGSADSPPARQLLESVARDSANSKAPVRVDHVGFGKGASGTSVLALPANVGDEMVALVILIAPGERLVGCAEAAKRHLLPVALGVDRYRMQHALERRGDEIVALRQQLDAYAVDFRSTYRAERDRAQQLAAALAELEATYLATVQGLAIAVEAKDECTGGHLQRVSRYGMMLTKVIAPEHANDLQFEYGFLLHDIGKLTVPDVVLGKPGKLTEDEWELMREHPASGRSILSGIPFLAGAREIVYAHHERWDGRGYPRGLVGAEIPLGAQIFPLCDAFDAMTSDRPYRRAMTSSQARAEILRASGSQFWPTAVQGFLGLPLEEVEHIRRSTHEMAA